MYANKPPPLQVMFSICKRTAMSVQQLTDMWVALHDTDPYPLVSLTRRVVIRHNIVSTEICDWLSRWAVAHIQIQTMTAHQQKDAQASFKVLLNDFTVTSIGASVLKHFPADFFETVREIFVALSNQSGATGVLIPRVFVPRRIQLNTYPAGMRSGIPQHWDANSMLGVLTILVSEPDQEGDTLCINDTIVPLDSVGWRDVGLRKGSGVAMLVSTPHAVRTCERISARVSVNIVF
jgi:hypothetical protein